jgi:hypothetical protein
MGRRVKVQLGLADGSEESCTLDWGSEAAGVKLAAASPSIGVATVAAPDVFAALLKLREQIEPRGIVLLCIGSRRDAYPARMLSEMARGLKVYVLHSGKQASKADIIDVFGPAARSAVATITEQRARYDAWFQSLK